MVSRCDAANIAAVAYGLLATLAYVYIVGPKVAERFNRFSATTLVMVVLALVTIAYILSVVVALAVVDAVCLDGEIGRAIEGSDEGEHREEPEV